MSLYRQPGRRRQRRRLIAAAIVALVAVVVLVVVLATGDSGPPSQAQRAQAARSAATEALNGLELLGIEYGQAVKDGEIVEPTEYAAAQADVRRTQDALRKHDADLEAVDPAARRQALIAVGRLGDAVRARVDTARMKELIRAAQDALAPFSGGG